MFACEQSFVAFQIKFEAAAVEPVYDMAALLRCDQLMHDDFAVVLDIAAVSSDHPVKTDIPQLLIDLRLASSGADKPYVRSPGPDGSL